MKAKMLLHLCKRQMSMSCVRLLVKLLVNNDVIFDFDTSTITLLVKSIIILKVSLIHRERILQQRQRQFACSSLKFLISIVYSITLICVDRKFTMFAINTRFQIFRQARRAYQKVDERSRLIDLQLRQLKRNVELQNRANRLKKRKVRRKRNKKKKRITKSKKIKIDDHIVVDQTRLNAYMMKESVDTKDDTKFKSNHHEIIVIDSKFSTTTSEKENVDIKDDTKFKSNHHEVIVIDSKFSTTTSENEK